MGGLGQMRGGAMQSGLRPGSMIDFTPGFIKASPAGKGHVSIIIMEPSKITTQMKCIESLSFFLCLRVFL